MSQEKYKDKQVKKIGKQIANMAEMDGKPQEYVENRLQLITSDVARVTAMVYDDLAMMSDDMILKVVKGEE